jgi:formamidopyrimidine-DNA glycosylase
MPELPEVETVRRQLAPLLEGALLEEVVIWESDKESPKGDRFSNSLRGRQVKAIDRRGKLLLWRLDDGSALLVHLKMTGKLLKRATLPTKEKRHKHDRLAFIIARGTQRSVLIWNDVRRFGYLKHVTDPGEIERIAAEYGREPLTSTPEELAEALPLHSSRSIKAVLLDQSFIAGVGNIYADEACFMARIHPARALRSLSMGERLHLATMVKTVLEQSVAAQGTSAHTYVDVNGEKGSFLGKLQVYGRTGQPCVRCEQPIAKSVLAGRGTHVCLACQSWEGSG